MKEKKLLIELLHKVEILEKSHTSLYSEEDKEHLSNIKEAASILINSNKNNFNKKDLIIISLELLKFLEFMIDYHKT